MLEIYEKLSLKNKIQISKFKLNNNSSKISLLKNLNLFDFVNNKIKCALDDKTLMEIFYQFEKNIIKIFFYESVTTQNSVSSPKLILIAKFDKIAKIKNFCKNLIASFDKIIYHSEFFIFNKTNLILNIVTSSDQDQLLKSLLIEFGATVEKGKYQQTIIKEHCKPIFLKNAIEKLTLI